MSPLEWPSTDLPFAAVVALAGLVVATIFALALELRGHPRRGRIATSGLVGLALVTLALLRPRVPVEGNVDRKAALAVIVDDTRSLKLPFDTRLEERRAAIAAVRRVAEGHPVRWFAMGGETIEGVEPDAFEKLRAGRGASSLSTALNVLRDKRDLDPLSVVLITDGRNAPEVAEAAPPSFREGVPVHTVALGKAAPDASVASVRVLGAAFAHGKFGVGIDVLCTGGLACGAIHVRWRALPDAAEEPPPPVEAVVDAASGRAHVEIGASFERPGRHAAIVSLEPVEGDTLPENDTRTILVDVRRERVRMLHVAGRPTNDVRALRRFLKANSSIDLVSFFILRTHEDDPHAPPSELSLIPFPVDELFEEHLSSFDAVVVQDIDAEEYGLARHLRRVARYVEAGGGLVLVGGPHAFAAGGFDRSSLAPVLPTALEAARPELQAPFVPRITSRGLEHPIHRAFERAGGTLDMVEGTSALGAPVPGAEVLWEHPGATTKSGSPMPVLAARSARAGRVVAVGTDGTWRLGFSEKAASGAGGVYDALWDSLIGWTLHDARFEAPPVLPLDGCVVGEPLRVAAPADGVDRAELLANGAPRALAFTSIASAIVLEPLAEGVHDLVLLRGDTVAAQGRIVCERGGQEWVDVRPDLEGLRAIARVTGGHAFASADAIDARILPQSRTPASARHERPIVAPWVLALIATLALGVHWYERRRFGLR